MDLRATTGHVPGFRDTFNLRELGGLPCEDGRRVRRGLFYRGSALAGLAPDERERVDSMGLRFILDLRAAGEVAYGPDYVPEGARYLRCGGMRYEDGSEVDFSPEAIERFEQEAVKIGEVSSFMQGMYQSMALGNPAVHALVEHVTAGDVPIYFHCTAGKDRTGVCALVIGLMLGVTREAMLDDFVLTNEYRRRIIETVADRMPADASPEEIERWRRANGVAVEDAEAFLDAVLERHGSAEAYFDQEFGLDAQALAVLRDRYLEGPYA